MPTYISLIKFTQLGVQKIKESPARIDSARAAFRAMGAEMKEFYMSIGRYDAIVISECPDEETVAKLLLMISAVGAIRTETMRMFTEEEYRNIIAALP